MNRSNVSLGTLSPESTQSVAWIQADLDSRHSAKFSRAMETCVCGDRHEARTLKTDNRKIVRLVLFLIVIANH